MESKNYENAPLPQTDREDATIMDLLARIATTAIHNKDYVNRVERDLYKGSVIVADMGSGGLSVGDISSVDRSNTIKRKLEDILKDLEAEANALERIEKEIGGDDWNG